MPTININQTNASETAKGIVEEATQAEVNAGTDTGGTLAKLFVVPSKLLSLLGSYLTTASAAATYLTIVSAAATYQTIAGLATAVLTTVLTGFSVGANTAIAATDTLAQALAKIQGQINARATGTGTANGTNTGDETAASIGTIVNAATNYVTPLDADKIGIWDTANGLFKAVTWSNIKATLKTYFDTLYASAVGDHKVVCDSGNGYGSSTGTKIRRFTNSATTGTAITYADSSTAGATFTINTAGLYRIDSSDWASTTYSVAISLNSANLTTNASSLTAAERLQYTDSAGGVVSYVGVTVKLAVSDIIRSHTDGSAGASTGNLVQFRITKIA